MDHGVPITLTIYIGMVDPAADGGWGVVFPDLPGCYSAGTDADDLLANASEAVRLWAEDAIEAGEALPLAHDEAELMADPKVRAELQAAGPRGHLIKVPLRVPSVPGA